MSKQSKLSLIKSGAYSTPTAVGPYKKETQKFLKDICSEEYAICDDAVFDEVFLTFDKDNDGVIDKNEMLQFIKYIMAVSA